MAKSKKSGKKTKTTQPAKDKKLSEDKKVDNKKTTKTEKSEKAVEAKAEKVAKSVKAEKAAEAPAKKEEIVSDKKDSFFKRFFAKKYEANENILNIFKNKRVYGALLGELFGTLFITLIILTLGIYQLLYLFLVFAIVVIAVRKLSGANLNPIATVAMMATRRMSVIRGVLYLLAQVVGAWLGMMIVSAFINGSGSEAELPSMTATPDGKFWAVTLIEFFGAVVIGFFYTRAQDYKKNPLAFAFVVAGGTVLALIAVYIISANFFGLDGTFMLNPAVALMYQILPQSANGVGELLGGIGIALLTYVIFPMLGGVVGSYLSDVANTFSTEE